MIELKGITKSFKNNGVTTLVLRDIDLYIEKSEFLVITGRSGSGKSTLLNILGTLLKPDEGEILFFEKKVDFNDRKQIDNMRKNDIAFIFQLHHLIPYLTAIENVLLPFCSGFLKVKKHQIDMAKEVLNWVGLGDKYYRLPSELSGGEQQRVAIARGLVKNPKLILADEPTGSLDKNTSYTIIELLKKINEKGVTVVMVTHEADYASIGDRRLVMEDGKIVDQ